MGGTATDGTAAVVFRCTLLKIVFWLVGFVMWKKDM